MAGRKPDFTEAELNEFTKSYIEDNPFRELNYTDIADYINRKIQPEKEITYRHLSRCQAIKDLVKIIIRGYAPLHLPSPEMGTHFL